MFFISSFLWKHYAFFFFFFYVSDLFFFIFYFTIYSSSSSLPPFSSSSFFLVLHFQTSLLLLLHEIIINRCPTSHMHFSLRLKVQLVSAWFNFILFFCIFCGVRVFLRFFVSKVLVFYVVIVLQVLLHCGDID